MFQKLKSVIVAAALLPTLASTVQAGDVVMLLGRGDSIGEAVQPAGASFRTQPFSYLNLLTKQMVFLSIYRSSKAGL